MRRSVVLGLALILGACSSDNSGSSTGGTAGSGGTAASAGAAGSSGIGGAAGGNTGGVAGASTGGAAGAAGIGAAAGTGAAAGSGGAAGTGAAASTGGAAGTGAAAGTGGSAGAGGSTNPNCIAFRDTCVSWHRVITGAEFVHGYASDGRMFGTRVEKLAAWSPTGSPLAVSNTDSVTGPLLVSGSKIAFRLQGSFTLNFYDYDSQQTTASSLDASSEFMSLGNGNYVDLYLGLEINGTTGASIHIPALPTVVPQNFTSFPLGNGEALAIGQDVSVSTPYPYKLMHYASHAWTDLGSVGTGLSVRAFMPERRELLLESGVSNMTSIVFDATYSSFTSREWKRQTHIGRATVPFKGADLLVQSAVQNGSSVDVLSGLYDVDADRLDSLPLPVNDPQFQPLFAFGDSAYWGNLSGTWRMDYGK